MIRTDDELFPGVILNISEAGLGFCSTTAIPTPAACEVIFSLPLPQIRPADALYDEDDFEYEPFSLKAEIVNHRADATHGNIYGVKYAAIPEHMQTSLKAYITRARARMQRRGRPID